VFDLSFLHPIPNLTIAVPKDLKEFEDMLEFSAKFEAPLAIRYPREGKHIFKIHSPIELGKWEELTAGGGNATIIACGETPVTLALASAQILEAEGISVRVINARFVKPLDVGMLKNIKEKFIITVEDNMLIGGFGSLINGFFAGGDKTIKNFAYKDCFIPQGGICELMEDLGLSCQAITDYIKNAIG
ncbi:MAG: 1-deoxy-D-xylulose-5-phosphate synthase, partial [Clostridia bacterium]|nr:1-deoxy-D-xylulose-5-phosphate synthase [Clostridia bacterium]